MDSQNIEQVTNNKSCKKMNKFLKFILILVSIIVFLILIVFIYYRTHIDISRKYNEYLDYNLGSNETIEYKVDDYFNYDSSDVKNSLFISIPKQYIYEKIVKLNDINKQINENFNANINRVGLISNDNDNSLIDFYLDCSYDDIINVLVHGSLKYEITETNGLKIYLNSINIGKNLPQSLIDKYLPIETQKLIYEIEAENVQILNSQLLQLDKINNINIDKDNINIEFNIYDNVKQIIINTYGENEEKINFLAKSLILNIIETFKLNLNKNTEN